MFHPVPSREWAGRIVAPCCHSREDCNPVEEVVGCVRQVDLEAHPYLPHLLLGPAGKLSPAFQLPCQSGRRARYRWSPVRTPSRSQGTDPAVDCFAVGDTGLGHPDQIVSRGHGPWSLRWSSQLGTQALVTLGRVASRGHGPWSPWRVTSQGHGPWSPRMSS
jgi:hypothetical protein